MSEHYASINGQTVASMKLTVPNKGPWLADCNLDSAVEVQGKVTIKVGANLTLQGTVDETASGVFGGQRRVRVVAGGNGWSKTLPAKGYHNDASIRARTVADDAAREAGEVIDGFVPRSERIGADYARQAGSASIALENAIGGALWWVDFAGQTQVGVHASSPIADADYDVLAYDPTAQLVTLGVADPAAIRIGGIVSKTLDGPKTIRDYELTITAGELRVTAWVGGSDESRSRLPQLLASIVERVMAGRLHGMYRYRVIGMASDRVNLQAVSQAAGLPDLLPVSMWPGIAGVHAELAPGAIVLVEFVEGNRALPVITHFVGKDGDAWAPTRLDLGGPNGPPAARQGDAVEVLLPPGIFSGTVNALPASGVITFTIPKTSGVITGGSGVVRIA